MSWLESTLAQFLLFFKCALKKKGLLADVDVVVGIVQYCTWTWVVIWWWNERTKYDWKLLQVTLWRLLMSVPNFGPQGCSREKTRDY